MEFKQEMELPEVAGLTFQLINQMTTHYLNAGQADPILYHTLRLAGELVDQYKECAVKEEAPEGIIDSIGELANQIHLQAMEVGAICREIIEENGLDPAIMGNIRTEITHHPACECGECREQ